MPILVIPSFTEGPAAAVNPLSDSRWLAFESLDGVEIWQATSRDFFIQEGIEGLEIPPREIITKRHPGMAGGRLKEVRTLEREIFLPLFLENPSAHAAYLDDLDRLAELFNYRTVDYAANDGTLNLVATSVRGERRLRCTYTEGVTGYGTDNQGATWASFGLKFLCVQPYWYGTPWTTPILRQEVDEPDFFSEFPPLLSASLTIGENIPVTVSGDVESWMTVDLVGPATSVTISGEGNLVSIPGGMADGSTVRIVTDPRGRTALFDGVRDWSRVGPTTTWAPLAPGTRTMSITLTGVGSNTRAVIYGKTLYERPW